MMNKFTFFWNGPFSQWYPSIFSVRGTIYNCAEQYMMAEKARAFHDFESHCKIMASKSPKEQKELGRKVSGFDEVEWISLGPKIVYLGNYFKFTQDSGLQLQLLATKGTTLVEASPYDRIWGIGLSADDPRALNQDTWRGMNLLGNILTEVREDLL